LRGAEKLLIQENRMLTELFSTPKPIIGMIHVGALPGTPANRQSIAEIIAQAVREAAKGVDSWTMQA
jgi:predicted TIM-barrel enzyme